MKFKTHLYLFSLFFGLWSLISCDSKPVVSPKENPKVTKNQQTPKNNTEEEEEEDDELSESLLKALDPGNSADNEDKEEKEEKEENKETKKEEDEDDKRSDGEEEEEEEDEEEEDYIPQKPVMKVEGDWILLGRSYVDKKTKKSKLVDKVRVNVKQKVVEVEGEVCLKSGLIELFACTERGKTHETAIVVFCAPSHLQAGLMMLGLKKSTRGEFPGDPEAQTGSSLDITVSWKVKTRESEETVSHPIHKLIWNAKTESPMEDRDWIFHGSFFSHDPIAKREVFVADVSGTIIATFNNPDTIIDSTHELKDDDTVFFANQNLLPEPGTAIILTIKPKALAKEEKK